MQNILVLNTDNKVKKYAVKTIAALLYILFPPLWLLAFLGCGIYGKVFKSKVTTFFNRYILPPVAVIGVFFFVYSQHNIYPFGNKTIAWCDMTQQGVPYWMNFKSVLEGEDGLFLSMSNAAGMNGWSLIKSFFFYPFSYLALIIERQSMMDAVSVVLVLKLAACSVTAMYFFKTAFKRLNPSLAVVLSLMYSFCAFGLMYYQIIRWPDTMYITPLFFAGVYRLIKEGKIALYSISLALVMNNFSFGFMTVLATILFFAYYLIANKNNCDKTIESNDAVAFNFVIGSVFAALLCAFSWLTFFGAYDSSARGIDLEESLKAESFFTSKNTIYPLLLSNAFIFVGLFSFKGYVKKPLEKACMFLFGMMIIPVVVEPINAMWHGGSYMSFPGRYVYILTFVGLTIAAAVLSREKNASEEAMLDAPVNSRKKWVTFLLNICTCYLLYLLISYVFEKLYIFLENNISYLDNYSTTLWGNADSYKHTLIIFGFFLFVYAVCYAVYRWKLITKQVLAMVMAVVVIFEAYCAIRIYVVPPTSKVDTESFRTYADLGGKIEDDDFYRVKNEKFLDAAYNISEANFPGAIGYKSMGHYSSLASETYLYFAKALGYSSMWMKIESFGGTKFSDAFMSVKYGITKADDSSDVVYKNELYQIVQKDNYLPLGLYSSETDLEVELTDITRIELQEMIYDSITGNKYDLFEEHSPTTLSSVTYNKSGDMYHIDPGSDAKGSMEYVINIKGTKTLYFDCFDKFSNELSEKIYNAFSIHVNGKKVKSKYPVNNNNGILNLGTFTDTTVTVKLGVLEKVDCRSFGVYSMDDELLDTTLLSVPAAELSVDGNEVYGKYTAEQDGVLVVAVPYDSGFECLVNGKAVKASKAFGGVIAVPVTKGSNTISLSYTPSMFYESFALVIFGILLGIAVLVIIKLKKKNTVYEWCQSLMGTKTVNVLSIISKIGTILALLAVIFAIYIYPMLLKLSNYTEVIKK